MSEITMEDLDVMLDIIYTKKYRNTLVNISIDYFKTDEEEMFNSIKKVIDVLEDISLDKALTVTSLTTAMIALKIKEILDKKGKEKDNNINYIR